MARQLLCILKVFKISESFTEVQQNKMPLHIQIYLDNF